MFDFMADEIPSSKCYFSRGALPRFIDPKQPPTKQKPFSIIRNQPFTHTVNLVLPKEIYHIVQDDVDRTFSNLQYCRVNMSLSEILEREFFNLYIKTGNILMLSEGRPGVDSRFSLFEGILRLELPKEVYERTGLVGKATRDGGRKHMKTRFMVEINLRQPSMLHGKKGFERIIWACKNVLNSSVTWLFYDLEESVFSEDHSDPLARHHPIRRTITPTINLVRAAKVPSFVVAKAAPEDEDWAVEVHEWLSLAALQSPRITADDNIDPYLCRYDIPSPATAEIYDFVSIKWTGLLSNLWIRRLFIELCTSRKSFPKSRGWFALSAYAFPTEVVNSQDGYTILRLADGEVDDGSKTESLGEYALWEMSDSIIS